MSHYECKICLRPYQYCECDQKQTNNEVKMTTLFDLLKFEEGYRAYPYICSEGYPTVGIGTKIGPKGASLDNYLFTVSKNVAKAMLEDDVQKVIECLARAEWYIYLNKDRQIIIQSMVYQMGSLGVAKFKNMIAALSAKDWQRAHDEALDSLWARQTPERAKRHAQVLLNGDLMEVYKGLV
jgi:lysozyme